MKAPIPESAHRAKDPNPRGGLRGARGISVTAERIVIANNERLFVYDHQWKLMGTITHPLMGGVHEILAEQDGVWITCTSSDLLLKMSWDGKVLDIWEWRRDRQLVRELGLPPLPKVNRKLDYRNPGLSRFRVRNTVHLNAVSRTPQGLVLSFGLILAPKIYRWQKISRFVGALASSARLKRAHHRRSADPRSLIPPKIQGSSWAAVLLQENGKAKVLKRALGTAVPNHNVLQVDNTLLYNDSNGGFLVRTSLNGNGSDERVSIPGEPSFARGLAQLNDGTFLVGSQAPTALYQVDFRTRQVIAACPLDGEPHETVFGICILPATCRTLPSRLDSI